MGAFDMSSSVIYVQLIPYKKNHVAFRGNAGVANIVIDKEGLLVGIFKYIMHFL